MMIFVFDSKRQIFIATIVSRRYKNVVCTLGTDSIGGCSDGPQVEILSLQ